VSSIKRSQGWY